MVRPSRRVRQFLPLPDSRSETGTDNGADGIDWDSGQFEDPAIELDQVLDVNAPTPSNGDVLTWDSTPGEWVASAPSGLTNPMTTIDDIIVGAASGVPDRLAKGSDGQVLTVDPTTHHLVWATPSGGGGVIVQDEGTPLATTATTLNFVGSGVVATGAGATKTITISGGGGSTDPIAALFGAPDTAFEFDTSSLAGLTAMGTPDVENANTTVPGNYYVKDDASGTAWCGRYIASPSHPFTAVLKVTGANMRQNYNGCGLFVGVGTPGKLVFVDIGIKTRTIGVEIFSSPTAYSSTPVGDVTNAVSFPCYLGLVTVSTTSVSYYFSMDGYVWFPILTGHNGALTIGSVGFASKSENTNGHASAFDFFRVWNSSKTFPG